MNHVDQRQELNEDQKKIIDRFTSLDIKARVVPVTSDRTTRGLEKDELIALTKEGHTIEVTASIYNDIVSKRAKLVYGTDWLYSAIRRPNHDTSIIEPLPIMLLWRQGDMCFIRNLSKSETHDFTQVFRTHS